MIGIAKPWVAPLPELPPHMPYEGWKLLPPAAVSIPITCPSTSTSEPPESPGWSCALVSIRPVRLSESVPPSLAVIERPTPTMLPRAELGVPPTPPAFPTATTASPTRTLSESPSLAVVRPDAFWSLRTAMSAATS